MVEFHVPMATTILDAAVTVLAAEKKPLSTSDIYDRIVERKLFTFAAKDPKAVFRAALRKHLRTAGSTGGAARIREVGKDAYVAA